MNQNKEKGLKGHKLGHQHKIFHLGRKAYASDEPGYIKEKQKRKKRGTAKIHQAICKAGVWWRSTPMSGMTGETNSGWFSIANGTRSDVSSMLI
jgi:hypothetical protein